MNFDLLDPPAPGTVAVGAGRLTLDVIFRGGPASARSQAGGTCGNVMADLAYLGWRTYPLTDLGDDDAGRRFCRDLVRWGVQLDLIRLDPDLETPVIVHHIRETESGAVHSFSSRCPLCGHRLRYYEPVPLAGVEGRLPRVPAAKAYFFDRDSEGSLLLARRCRQQGALVVYEPNYAGEESNVEAAAAVADVFKVAGEKLHDLIERHPLRGPLLVVETLGAEGLRYRDQREDNPVWRHLPAWPVPVVRDAGGSGDWCTAGLIHALGWDGRKGLGRATADEVREALRFGQALAAWNCAFEGARGGMYAVEHERFRGDVRRILAGERFDPAEGSRPSTHDVAGRYCRHCGG